MMPDVEFQLDLHHFSIGRDPHMPEQSCLHTVRYVASGGPLPNKKAGHILVDINGSEPLSGFSGHTAMQLVRDGRAHEVLEYIDAIDAGVHA
ncbi:DUF2384 domain-containing protein [Agrobacterium fabrum]|uniref:Uncharacterized protein n=1 Tax=Agrobacterium fabrum TaxID=1176649 RepID=A0A7Z7FUF0_9HYPH|nr:DUF2384 domain-containing protein [Agrobacterium fabrum]MCR6727119.1 DUF2384 domain-containing protein [Agrobacterium fabrum]SDB74462.1 Protein of unknown function [Agrobacterium fabrum]SDK55921.1 Protein of unknown function [Agrobacterium fabrum]SES24867.1 Protein of unknown function [Agrobacterium fabrum]